MKILRWKINEIFYSIQGEGHNTGLPFVFVRFSGCNLKCDFCDTMQESYKFWKIADIINEVKKYPCKNVVLTGGEPSIYDLEPIVKELKKFDYYIAIETNGTGKIPDGIDFVTVSPKTADFLKKGNELKLVYKGQDLRDYENLDFHFFYLQPCSNKNVIETYNAVLANPKWRLSLQIHKLIGVR